MLFNFVPDFLGYLKVRANQSSHLTYSVETFSYTCRILFFSYKNREFLKFLHGSTTCLMPSNFQKSSSQWWEQKPSRTCWLVVATADPIKVSPQMLSNPPDFTRLCRLEPTNNHNKGLINCNFMTDYGTETSRFRSAFVTFFKYVEFFFKLPRLTPFKDNMKPMA